MSLINWLETNMKFLMEELSLAVGLLLHTPVDVDPLQLICLTRNVYHESRGEPQAGQIAVADVTLNRVKTDICDAVYAKNQFSWTSDGLADEPKDLDAYQDSMLSAIEALANPDTTKGADHFFAHKKVKPYWAKVFITTITIGNHTFQRSK